MREGDPSSSAFQNAFLRAAHQCLDDPRVFDDPLALRLVGGESEVERANAYGDLYRPGQRSMRAYMAARSRFVEESLGKAITNGTRQYVALGAGFDTLSFKPSLQRALNVFEVDFPATQAAKQALLRSHSIPVPAHVHFVPADFENEGLIEALRAAGLDLAQSSFVSLIGVSYYLTESAFWRLVGAIAGLPCVTGFALDIFVPLDRISKEEAAGFQQLASQTAGDNEPYRLHLDERALCDRLTSLKFATVECLDSEAINDRYFVDRDDNLFVDGELIRLIGACR